MARRIGKITSQVFFHAFFKGKKGGKQESEKSEVLGRFFCNIQPEVRGQRSTKVHK